MILTDSKGKPFDRPELPPAGAGIEEQIAFQRALAAYNDAVASAANKAFSASMNAALKRKRTKKK